MQEQNGEQAVGRRRLLRRAGTVVAGVAGAGVVGSVVASPAAQAAPGEAVLQGQANDAGTATTGLTASVATGATLELSNTSVTNGEAGAALRLVPSGDIIAAGTPAGGISVDQYGNIWVAAPDGSETFPEYVHTQRTSNTIIPIAPTRVVDTRLSSGRQYIMNPSGNLSSTGQLLGGKSIQIDLSEFVFFAEGVFLNATVVTPINNGYLTVWPTGLARPITSNVNFTKSQNLSNYALTVVGMNDLSLDVISVFTSATAHVIIDVTAFVIGYGQVNPAYTSAGTGIQSAGGSREAKAKAGKPSWEQR
jgi:hypothetical protein